MSISVFLGGTYNSKWREALIQRLNVKYFNPVLKTSDAWNEEAQKREEQAKKECTHQLYVITPRMHGVFSIAEVVDASCKNPKHTVLCVLSEDEGKHYSKEMQASLLAVEKLVSDNGAVVLTSLYEVAKYFNDPMHLNWEPNV
jgi:hypothetical protein